MKEFLRTLLASVLGALIALFLAASLVTALFAEPPPARLPARAILVLGSDLAVNDSGGAPSLGAAAQGATLPVPLRRLVAALDAAAAEDRIVGLLLQDGGPICEDWAQRREVRGALQRFRANGKRVWAHSGSWDEAGWYLASVADRALAAPLGLFTCDGFAAQMFYFGDALQRLGVHVQSARTGGYKSASEPFTLSRSSPENDAQVAALLEDLEVAVFGDCEEARRLPVGALREFAQAIGTCSGEEAVRRGFLDGVATTDALLAELAEAAGAAGSGGGFRQIGWRDWLRRAESGGEGGVTVAVEYAVGEIVDGESALDAGGATVARSLRARRLDPAVDAVVLRVNSPGGSAAASEVIRREVELLREAGKPVVVSMGGVAASGGYWIACPASRILAEAGTVTGSIGVLALLPDVSPLLGRLGVTVSTVRTAPHADALDLFRPRDAEEMQRVQEMVDSVYEGFVDRVAQGRDLPRERVLELAQGRVWSGRDAVELGLADAIGSLGDALRAAADLAGAAGGSFRVLGGEIEPGPLERMVNDLLEGSPEPLASLPSSWRDAVAGAAAAARGLEARAFAQARLPFSLAIR